MVLLAKKEGLVTDIAPLLKELAIAGLRVSGELLEKVLQLAGESRSW